MRTTEELLALEPAWKALWREDADATPFQSAEWLLPWWRQFGQPDLRTVTISQSGILIGILPFYVYRDPQTGERQLLLLGVGTSDYLNGVFAPACTTGHIEHALALLCGEDGWDVLFVSQMLDSSRLAQAFERWGARSFATEGCSRMPAVAIADLPLKIRRNAMYYRNRAFRLGRLELTTAGPANWREAFDALQRLHTARWRERGEQGVLTGEAVLAWHREALPRLAQSGLLRLCALRLNGEIIAVLYSLLDPPGTPMRSQYFYITAYSTMHADLRPGTLLLALAIENAAAEGVQAIDMLRGDEPYKQIWHMNKRATVGFTLRAGSVRDLCPGQPGAAA